MNYVEFPCNPKINLLPFTPCLLIPISLHSQHPHPSFRDGQRDSPISFILTAEDMVKHVRMNMDGFTQSYELSRTHPGLANATMFHRTFNAVSTGLQCRLCHWTPWHWNQDPALHLLNQRHCLVNRLSPSFHTPTHLSSRFSLFEICKLPEVMHGVQISDLDEPCTNPFHHFSPGFEAPSPVCLPLK